MSYVDSFCRKPSPVAAAARSAAAMDAMKRPSAHRNSNRIVHTPVPVAEKTKGVTVTASSPRAASSSPYAKKVTVRKGSLFLFFLRI